MISLIDSWRFPKYFTLWRTFLFDFCPNIWIIPPNLLRDVNTELELRLQPPKLRRSASTCLTRIATLLSIARIRSYLSDILPSHARARRRWHRQQMSPYWILRPLPDRCHLEVRSQETRMIASPVSRAFVVQASKYENNLWFDRMSGVVAMLVPPAH